MTEDEMGGWHHHLNGYEFEQTPGDSERQGNLQRKLGQGQKVYFGNAWLSFGW